MRSEESKSNCNIVEPFKPSRKIIPQSFTLDHNVSLESTDKSSILNTEDQIKEKLELEKKISKWFHKRKNSMAAKQVKKQKTAMESKSLQRRFLRAIPCVKQNKNKANKKE